MKAKIVLRKSNVKVTLSIQEAWDIRNALAAGTNLYNATSVVKEFLEMLTAVQAEVDDSEEMFNG